jgi:predicted nucleic acid-binding protein
MVLADTGVCYGASDRDDPRHADCAAVLDAHNGDLVIPVPVVVETAC